MTARDAWDDFAEVFAEELAAPLTPAQMDAMADEYQRDAIASAQSEAAFAANVKEFSK